MNVERLAGLHYAFDKYIATKSSHRRANSGKNPKLFLGRGHAVLLEATAQQRLHARQASPNLAAR